MLEKLKWDNSLSVKVKQLDDQHKSLITIINLLQEAITDHRQEEALSEIISNLKEYAIHHFESEEKLFTQFNFKFNKEHKKEHNDFKIILDGYTSRMKTSPVAVSEELLIFLKAWLINHIFTSDRKYISLFKAKGLT